MAFLSAEAAFAALALPPSAPRLMLIGGGPRPAEALDRFVGWAGGEQSRILVVTWASREPEENFRAIAEDLRNSNAGEVVHAPSPDSAGKDLAGLRRELDAATAVFFSGGDQTRLMKAIADLDVADFIRSRHAGGLPVGGTSAGTAVLSSLMIAGRNPVKTAPGLGLLAGAVVDQHFLKRERLARLAAVIEKQAGLVGIGIDEGSAVAIEDGRRGEAIGPSPVTLIRRDPASGAAAVTQVSPGLRFELLK